MTLTAYPYVAQSVTILSSLAAEAVLEMVSVQRGVGDGLGAGFSGIVLAGGGGGFGDGIGSTATAYVVFGDGGGIGDGLGSYATAYIVAGGGGGLGDGLGTLGAAYVTSGGGGGLGDGLGVGGAAYVSYGGGGGLGGGLGVGGAAYVSYGGGGGLGDGLGVPAFAYAITGSGGGLGDGLGVLGVVYVSYGGGGGLGDGDGVIQVSNFLAPITVTLAYTDFSGLGGSAGSKKIFTGVAKTYIEAVFVKPTVQWAATGSFGINANVGYSSGFNYNDYISTVTLNNAVSNTVYGRAISNVEDMVGKSFAAVDIYVYVAVSGANLSALTAGTMDVTLLVTTFP